MHAPRRSPHTLSRKPLSISLDDPVTGSVHLEGWIDEHPSTDSVVLILPGLGSNADVSYCVQAAEAAFALGCTAVRLGLRGFNRRGEDIPHAGLTADLHAAVGAPEIQRYEKIYVLGLSMSGNTSLLFATETRDPRVRAVATICAPLDMYASQVHIDQLRLWPYRRYLLSGLKDIFSRYAERRGMVRELAELPGIRTFYAWDRFAVVPRFGFLSASHYHSAASAGPHLSKVRVPALALQSKRDPMIPAEDVRDYLVAAAGKVETIWLDVGGHVCLPANLDLGLGGTLGVAGQALGWMLRH